MGKRILVFTTSYPRFENDSSGHFIKTEVERLLQQGHQVTVLAAGNAPPAPHKHQGEEVYFIGGGSLFNHPGALPRIKQAPWRAIQLLTVSRTLLRFLQDSEQSYDRVIAHWMLPSAYPWAMWGFARKLPLSVVLHGSDVRLFLKLPQALRIYIFRALRARDATLRFVSLDLKNTLLRLSLPQDLWTWLSQSTVQPASLSLPQIPSRAASRRRLQISPSTRLALFVGRLVKEKRADTALAAAALIPGAKTVVIGDGPERKKLENKYKEVIFTGQLNRQKTLTWMRAADVLLTPSLLEGAPTVVREARTLGVPVVSAPSGDLPSWSKNDSELYLVSPRTRGSS